MAEMIRSATFEGMADKNGIPTAEYKKMYENLAKNQVKTIITGFMFISDSGRAMHPGQAGLDHPDKIAAFKEITDAVHQHGSKIIAQLAHTGRQTTNTGFEIVGVSGRKSSYFNERPRGLATEEIYDMIVRFANCALYAKEAGFDGIQLHAAHGYLIHQFLLDSLNNRTDERFLELIIKEIREKTGDFPIWIKISGAVDIEKYNENKLIRLVKLLNKLKIDLIEVSYGSMDYALNIFRGGIPLHAVLHYNPIYRNKSILYKLFVLPFIRAKIKPFTPMYNMKLARIVKENTDIPVAVVGGFRLGCEIHNCDMDYVSLCRPFICEPDFLLKLKKDRNYQSKCTNCNLCAIMVDTDQSLKCYGGNGI